MKNQIARRYAEAFFQAIPANNRSALAQEFAQALIVLEDQEVKRIFTNPSTSNSRKTELVKLMGLSKTLEQFISLIIEKKRDSYLSQIEAEFNQLVLTSQMITIAEVASAVELNEDTRLLLQQKLEQITGKQVLLKHSVQPEIGGGLIIKVDGKVIDGSVANTLERFRQNLALNP